MTSTSPIIIRGQGIVSAIGDGTVDFSSGLIEGRSAITSAATADISTAPHSSFDPARTLGPKPLRPYDRTSLFAITAIEQALSGVASRDSLGLILGTTFSSASTMALFDRRCLERGPSYASPMDFANSVINAASGQAAIWHKLEGLNSTLTGGMSVGLRAILHGCDLLTSGRERQILAGGVDELSEQSIAGLQQAGLLCPSERTAAPIPFDDRRNGISLGEGAAILLLEIDGSRQLPPSMDSSEVRERIGILGYSVGFDPHRGRSRQSLTDCLSTTIRSALDNAQCRQDQLDAVSAAANGSPTEDRIEAEALVAALGSRIARQLPIYAIKAASGEPFGAGGAFQLVAASAMIEQQRVPGIVGWQSSVLPLGGLSATPHTPSSPIRRVLVESFDDDGCCCALILGTL